MGRLSYTHAARRDLLELWVHIAKEDPSAADRVVDNIERACGRLRNYPHLGPERPEIGPGASILIIGRWLALYRLVQDGTQIVRVVDGARDLGLLSWPPDER